MDLFEREQNILDAWLDRLKNDTAERASVSEIEVLVKEYGRLLKQTRRLTRLSDKTTENLNTSKHDLLDKVHYDALTGIHNRRFMEENLNSTISTLALTGGTISLFMIDVDFFKRFNDRYGHSVGDDCLREVAQALKNSLTRSGDFVARYGGEEFAVILPNANEEGAKKIAQKMLKSVSDKNILHENSTVAPFVTVSIGVTTGVVKAESTAEDLIKRADAALYMSKNNGRNKCSFIAMEE